MRGVVKARVRNGRDLWKQPVVLDVFRAVLEPVLDGLCGGHSLEVSVDVDADAS